MLAAAIAADVTISAKTPPVKRIRTSILVVAACCFTTRLQCETYNQSG
jgi:hypothetical protein